MRFPLISFMAYEALWFAAVIGASHGYAWPVVGLAAAFVTWQLIAATDRRVAVRLVLVAIVLGAGVDGGATVSGWIRYAASSPSLPPGGAPLWIIGLWASFGITLAGPFRWIAGRPGWAALLGAVGGPLSYLGAARGWQSVRFVPPSWHGLAWLALTWAVALAILSLVAASGRSGRAATVEGSSERRVE